MPNNFTNMLIGEYIHSVDSKGRTSLPSKFKTMMGERVVLSRGFDKTLTVYTLEAWEKLNEKLSSLSISKEAERRFARFMLSGAVEVEVDKQGRIRIPDFLRDYAEINDKKVVWTGVGDKAEIWSEKNWNTYIEETTKNPEKIAESLEGII